MAGQYELKKFLRNVSMVNLKDYLGTLVQWDHGIKWEGLDSIDPVFEAIQNAPEEIRGRINGDLQ